MRKKALIFLFLSIFLIRCGNDSKPKIQEVKEQKPTANPVPECDELLKIFHTVSINDGSIVLRKNISTLKNLVTKTNENIYSLKKGSFQVADSMAVEVNQNNDIISIIAAYEYEPEFSNDTAYIHELHKYQKMLCKYGKEFTHTGNDITFKVTKWEAGNIIFELVEENKKGRKKSYSVIFDKEWYCEKYKSKVDLCSGDNSFELFNRLGKL